MGLVTRLLVLASLPSIIAVSGCVSGKSCGYGRCADDEECVSVFSPPRDVPVQNRSQYPRVDNEWWCVFDGPTDERKNCEGKNMRNALDSEVESCASSRVIVRYYGEKEAAVKIDGQCTTLEVASYTVGIGENAVSCLPEEECEVGLFTPSSSLPTTVLVEGVGGESGSIGLAEVDGHALGQLLPGDVAVTVFMSTTACE